MKSEIILVEDDSVIAELVEFNLQNEGYKVRSFRDGASLFKNLVDQNVEVAVFVLDIMLPGMDGFEICAKLRRDERYALTPVLMLTARGTESDKVKGLETGADDYLTKPFGMREFLARVQVLYRRNMQLHSVQDRPNSIGGVPVNSTKPLSGNSDDTILTHPGMITAQGIRIDDIRHRVFKDDIEIEMTHREYELLKFLMIHRGVAYSRDDLLNYVWGYEYSGETRTVDVHIRQLRRKLEVDDAHPLLIETVRGRGYRFCEKND